MRFTTSRGNNHLGEGHLTFSCCDWKKRHTAFGFLLQNEAVQEIGDGIGLRVFFFF